MARHEVKPPPPIAKIEFALYPTHTLHISLLHIKPSQNPHRLSKKIFSAIPHNTDGESYAILDATRIVSLSHVALAANMALLRLARFKQQQEEASKESISETKRTNGRGAALETIVCAGGSTNVGNVLREFAFDVHMDNIMEEDDGGGDGRRIIFLGYNCASDDEFRNVMDQVGLLDSQSTTSSSSCTNEDGRRDMNEYFGRERSSQEMQDMMKIYKLTKEELSMSSLEQAVLNRVGTKFVI